MEHVRTIVFSYSLLLMLTGCASSVRFSSDLSSRKSTYTSKEKEDFSYLPGTSVRGIASYYADKFHGRQTSSGEIFDMNLLTAAHRTYPFGTIVNVKNLRNGKSVEVKINDRGPFVDDRIIDLSKAAAEQIGMVASGTAEVEITVISVP